LDSRRDKLYDDLHKNLYDNRHDKLDVKLDNKLDDKLDDNLHNNLDDKLARSGAFLRGATHGVNMAPQGEATLPATRRTRKSIAGGPSTRRTLDKENATLDVESAMAGTRKKSRSKSIGPGGLDALKMGSGNRRAVGCLACSI
jgi:hypothetical protein